MATLSRLWIPASMIAVFFVCIAPPSSAQSSPQNIETFYPAQILLQPIPPKTPATPNPSTPPSPPPSSLSSKGAVAKAVAATAASTLAIAGLLLFMAHRRTVVRRRREIAGGSDGSDGGERVVPLDDIPRLEVDLKELIVDEDGLDVIYWKMLQGGDVKTSFKKEVNHYHPNLDVQIHRERNHETKQDKPITSQDQDSPLADQNRTGASSGIAPNSLEKTETSVPQLTIPEKQSPASPPPPPVPPLQSKRLALSAKPLPPPLPPPRSKGPLPLPPGRQKDQGKLGQPSADSEETNGNEQVKLKPLHWDKVSTNTDHSMVWDKLDGGSFRFNGDLMEALFGYVATDKKSPQRSTNSANPKVCSSCKSGKIFILDPRKSQNTAIVLRSIAISRREILDSLTQGQGLSPDALEKLTRIAPTKEEESLILAFEGDPTRLADAESFLFHLLKAVPSAFSRLKAMLFRLNYGSEILHFKEILETLELGCKELRSHRLFFKLLEAILKAGNRMNDGTARGNAHAFNLTALQKLTDVKSTDGKTTLLHFVVEEVIRSEGKRCALNQSRHSSDSSSSSLTSSKRERENEYIKLGLPVVGGLSTEFSNVKKAATTDREALSVSCSALATHAREIRQILTECGSESCRGGFEREMESFISAAEEEVEEVRKEQRRVMEVAKRTMEYYQAGAWKEHKADPLQLFVIVRDFLGMVDQACVDIARNLQKRKVAEARTELPSSPKSTPVKFQNLPAHFTLLKSRIDSSNSSDTDNDF